MTRAKTAVIADPMAGVRKVMDVTTEAVSDGIKTTAKGVSKGIYYPFYYTSFVTTYVLLIAFSLVVNNPIGKGIRDGAIAASNLKDVKKAKGR